MSVPSVRFERADSLVQTYGLIQISTVSAVIGHYKQGSRSRE